MELEKGSYGSPRWTWEINFPTVSPRREAC